MNSLFFEEEIEFSTVKGTNHGKIAWSSDGNFEVIATTALNWQSWLDENYASKKYLELCKELAKVGMIQKWIIFSKNGYITLPQTNYADTKTVKQLINGNVFKRGVLPYGWTSSSIGVSYQKCYGEGWQMFQAGRSKLDLWLVDAIMSEFWLDQHPLVRI